MNKSDYPSSSVIQFYQDDSLEDFT